MTHDELRKNFNWEYLESDSDFRSTEVKRLRDEADEIITDSIPIDYDGVMGVPITFLDKYCREQTLLLRRTPKCAGLIGIT